MSDPAPITPLRDALAEADGESALRERYADYLPVERAPIGTKSKEGDKRKIKGQCNVHGPRAEVKSKQRFDIERDEKVFQDAEVLGQKLHGATRPPIILQNERPEHRFLVFLYAQGMSTKDIFTQLGGVWDSSRNLPVSGTGQYSYQHLHNIRRQAWFQKNLIAYMDECGKDLIKAKLEAELMPSIDRVIKIRDNDDAPASVQLSAANSLIDRFLGKATQQVVVTPASSVERYEKEADEIERETRAIDEELRNLNPALLT